MKLLLIVFLLFVSFPSIGQKIITGMVADSATFRPLPYVTVQIKNKAKGTISDSDGNFKIVANEEDTLVFSFLGYSTVEMSARGWEPNLILMAEKATMLKTIEIVDSAERSDYEDLFSEDISAWEKSRRKLPFYYSRTKKEKIRVGRLEDENVRVKTYVDLIVKNDETKNKLMQKYNLTEAQYYDILGGFNARNYRVMYFLSAPELLTLLNRYFEAHHSDR
jgi:hypothetical protein